LAFPGAGHFSELVLAGSVDIGVVDVAGMEAVTIIITSISILAI
jgi:hypothetical protein